MSSRENLIPYQIKAYSMWSKLWQIICEWKKMIRYSIGLLVKTGTTSIRDLPSKIILLVEMKARGRTMRDQPWEFGLS